jgi:hypothetical protein
VISRSKSSTKSSFTVTKENHTVTSLRHLAHRLKSLVALGGVAVAMGLFLTATPVHAAAPWWQLSAGARPTHIVPGAGQNEIQELSTTTVEFEGHPEQAALALSVGGEGVGSFATEPTAAKFSGFGFKPLTAPELQAALETAYGAGNVSVTQEQTEPGAPLVFRVASEGESAFGQVESLQASSFGIGKPAAAVLVKGRPDGELFVFAENVGDAALDAAQNPVVIADTLPPGLEAIAVDTNVPRGSGAIPHPFPCSSDLSTPTCTFTGFGAAQLPLPPYELLEMRIAVVVKSGAAPGEQNSVAVSGGGAAPASLSRPLALASGSAEDTPFGVEDFRYSLEEEGGARATAAASHPFQFTTTIELNGGRDTADIPNSSHTPFVEPPALVKDVHTKFPSGFVGDPSLVPTCSLADFLTLVDNGNLCSPESALGVASVSSNEPTFVGNTVLPQPLFNLEPYAGEPARFGFFIPIIALPILLDPSVRSGAGEGALPGQSEDYGLDVNVTNINQTASLSSARVTTWGVPADPRHDLSRGWACMEEARGEHPTERAPCRPSAAIQPPAFLTLPTSCAGPLQASVEASSWLNPHSFATFLPSEPLPALDSCNQVPFAPTIHSEPTSDAATSPTGLAFDLDFANEGLRNSNPDARAEANVKKAVVTLPQGFTTNPSVAEGLKACTQAEYEAATVQLGTGCTPESKVGDVEIESPLVSARPEHVVKGGIYVAQQGLNPNHNLLTLYLIARAPELGVIIRQALKVTPDPKTGQLTTEVDNIPQLPFSHFHLSFRQGQRSPLVTPPACGTYTVTADLYPYSNPTSPLHRESSFKITVGPEGLPCPSGGVPPFHPLLEAGTQNNAAGTYSPFYTHMTRKDSEQEITHFSIKLPPGVIGKLAGVSSCSDAAIAAAKAREHEGGGGEEEQSPSCPANSEVGRSLVGSGVGNVLAYAPGKLYLAGPYHGSNISLVSITAAKVGPFDLGTVVVRFALKIDPETAEVFVDGQGSDPIPHIVDGIPVHLRDIRAYVDRPNFTLNPTSCAKKSTASTVLGSGLNFASEADDQPVTVTSPFQAADCANLGFAPKLALSLKGGTKRGATPAFKAVVTYPKGSYANIAKSVVTLPHSEFLEQSHIKTICTRAQFKEGKVPGEKCPAASVYGRAEAVTPLLSEPLKGPVYLRSSSHNLPDLVAALHNNQVDFALDGRIDSVRNGRIRNTFETVPDAPVSKFVLEMQGGKKGLLVNSTNLCKGTNRAISEFTGQNGKLYNTNPVLSARCGGKDKKKSKAHKGGKAH